MENREFAVIRKSRNFTLIFKETIFQLLISVSDTLEILTVVRYYSFLMISKISGDFNQMFKSYLNLE